LSEECLENFFKWTKSSGGEAGPGTRCLRRAEGPQAFCEKPCLGVAKETALRGEEGCSSNLGEDYWKGERQQTTRGEKERIGNPEGGSNLKGEPPKTPKPWEVFSRGPGF